jgi:hypothetical protein
MNNDNFELSARWKLYEEQKAKIAQENLNPEEYTRRIVELCKKLEL